MISTPMPSASKAYHREESHFKIITRPFQNLLKRRKDQTRLPIPTFHGIQRSSSLKCQSTQEKPDQTPVFPASNNGNSDSGDSNHPPSTQGPPAVKLLHAVPVPIVKIARAATFRLADDKNNDDKPENNLLPPGTSVPPQQLSRPTAEELKALRLKYQQPDILHSNTSSLLISNTTTFTERIRYTIQSFPTIIQQQIKGPNFTPRWNWPMQIQRLVDESLRKHDKGGNSGTDQAFMTLYQQTHQASTLINQIRLDFQFGVMSSHHHDFDKNHYLESASGPKSKRYADIIRHGERGRNTVSLGMLPYMTEIFRHEMKKQDLYAKWMSKPRSDSQAQMRNKLVKWVCKVGAEELKYPGETIHLAVYLIDAFLTSNRVAFNGWYLLGIAALQIAGKLEEPTPASTRRLIRLSEQYYRNEQVHWMEKEMLQKLKYDLCPPLAPVIAQIILLGGSLTFPNDNIKKLVIDLSMGILYKALLDYKYSRFRASDKAQAALEVAVEFIFYQYKLYSQRDLSRYLYVNHQPGKELGQFVLDLCLDVFQQHLTYLLSSTNNIIKIPNRVGCAQSTVSVTKGVPV